MTEVRDAIHLSGGEPDVGGRAKAVSGMDAGLAGGEADRSGKTTPATRRRLNTSKAMGSVIGPGTSPIAALGAGERVTGLIFAARPAFCLRA